jgi:hypothetical protein
LGVSELFAEIRRDFLGHIAVGDHPLDQFRNAQFFAAIDEGFGEPIAELGIELLNLGFFGLVVVLAGVLTGATEFGVGDRVGS